MRVRMFASRACVRARYLMKYVNNSVIKAASLLVLRACAPSLTRLLLPYHYNCFATLQFETIGTIRIVAQKTFAHKFVKSQRRIAA